MIILDTNVLSELMLLAPNQKVVSWLDQQAWPSLWTTSITVFEIRAGIEILAHGRRQITLARAFEEILTNMKQQILFFDTEAAEHASALTASRKTRGRPRELRDTMIAGIVVSRHATLATRNIRDFDDISALVVDPWAGRI
jgi:predicted nucleic acid-binding protein